MIDIDRKECTDMVKFERVRTGSDWDLLAEKAGEVWREYFPRILAKDEIEYMIDKFQSPRAFAEQKKEGYEYYFIEADGAVGGYVGIKFYDDHLYLSKFYILKEYRSKGYGRKAFEFLKRKALKAGLHKISLNVNKYNEPTIAVYEKLGFRRVGADVKDIGDGYVMDDFNYEAEF